MSHNGWGFYMQGSDQQIEREELGMWLHVLIQCPVHFPAWGKPLYECEHGVLFPLWALQACHNLGENGRKQLIKQHQDGFKPQDGSMTDLGMLGRNGISPQEH